MATTIKFEKPTRGDFHNMVKQRVDEYFAVNGIAMTGNKALYYKAAIIFGAFIVAYAAILATPLFPFESMLLEIIWVAFWYGFLGFVIPALGFNIMHDAMHGSFSSNKKLNGRIAFWSGDASGGSTFAWDLKHNRLHHTYTNIDEHDDDIAKYPMFRLSPHQPWLPRHRYQHRYAKVLYLFLSLQWSLFNDFKKVVIDKKVLYKDLNAKPWDYIRFGLGKLVNIIIFLLPAFILPHWWYALGGYLLMHFITGYTLAIVFQMAHVVEGPEFLAAPPDGEKMENVWREHQMRTTANFDMHNKFLTWYVGGLNYQIEHHLFPKISHVHYPAISGIVQKIAKEFGLPYHVFDTFKEARKSHFHHLKMMGRKPYVPQAA